VREEEESLKEREREAEYSFACDGAIEGNDGSVHSVCSCRVCCRSCGGGEACENAITEEDGAENFARVSGGVRHAAGASAPGGGCNGGRDARRSCVGGWEQTENASYFC
jgi:hypothetical protein